jgi:hypothetical protein
MLPSNIALQIGFDGVEAAGGELNRIRWHDTSTGSIPMFPARLRSAIDRLS